MYKLEEQKLYELLIEAEKKLLEPARRIKLERTSEWRKKHLKNTSAIYVLFEKDKLVYVGETGNLLERMSDITRTYNHSFRKQVGAEKFGGKKSSKKFSPEIEEKLDKYFDDEISLSFIEVNFGRLEIETYLVHTYQEQIFNTEKKRKPQYDNKLLERIKNASR